MVPHWILLWGRPCRAGRGAEEENRELPSMICLVQFSKINIRLDSEDLDTATTIR